MKNLDLRVFVSENQLKYREIAEKMGVSPEWLSKLMRHELSKKNRERILEAIRKLKSEKK